MLWQDDFEEEEGDFAIRLAGASAGRARVVWLREEAGHGAGRVKGDAEVGGAEQRERKKSTIAGRVMNTALAGEIWKSIKLAVSK